MRPAHQFLHPISPSHPFGSGPRRNPPPSFRLRRNARGCIQGSSFASPSERKGSATTQFHRASIPDPTLPNTDVHARRGRSRCCGGRGSARGPSARARRLPGRIRLSSWQKGAHGRAEKAQRIANADFDRAGLSFAQGQGSRAAGSDAGRRASRLPRQRGQGAPVSNRRRFDSGRRPPPTPRNTAALAADERSPVIYRRDNCVGQAPTRPEQLFRCQNGRSGHGRFCSDHLRSCAINRIARSHRGQTPHGQWHPSSSVTTVGTQAKPPRVPRAVA